MAKITMKSLQEKLAAREAEAKSYFSQANEARTRAEAADKALKESRDHFADLKERLSSADAETARLRGYLERVHEDDIVRDGFVEIEDREGKRSVPKRPPPQQLVMSTNLSPDFTTDEYGRRKKRVHWTSY